MNHWIIAPVILPALIAPLIVLAMRHDLGLQRIFSLAATLALAAVAVALMLSAASNPPQVYQLGDWPAPFGIVLVLDRLSALMVLMTALLALAALFYAVTSGWDARGRHFHALFQFQLMGVCGAFLTGDVFNLFVFFEVLLIASYGLMLHGGGAARLKAGMQYVVINLAGSTLFLFAVGAIYAVTGTLNMADLALRVAEIPAEQSALIRVAAVLLLAVFAVKAALIPLHFWLPATYADAPAPIAALFAIMTKIGAYAILRVFTLIFGPGVVATQGLVGTWLMPAALVTLAVGMIGVLGARQMGRLAAFAAIGSMGTLLVAIALFTPQGTAAALYYMVHSTLAGAMLFLVVDLVRARRAGEADWLTPAPLMAQSGLVASLFFAAAIAMAGMPPLSGFLGKLLVMDAVRSHPLVWTIWAVILTTSLVAVLGFARAGSALFWNTLPPEAAPDAPAAPTTLPFVATGGLLAMLTLLTLAAGPVTGFMAATAAQLTATGSYISAVLPDAPDAPDAPDPSDPPEAPEAPAPEDTQ